MWWTDRARAAARGRRLALACAGLAAGALAGCAGAPAAPLASAPPPKTPFDQYPIAVDRTPERVALSIHATGLSAAQRDALSEFARRWREGGGEEPVTVETPRNSREAADPRLAASGVARALLAAGLPASVLRAVDYDAAGQAGAPVVARFARYTAEIPDCTRGWDNLTSTIKNRVSTHFGCSGAANLAAQVADARDLVRPADTAPADSARRAAVLEKYRQGVVTSSAKDAQAAGVVSSAVN